MEKKNKKNTLDESAVQLLLRMNVTLRGRCTKTFTDVDRLEFQSFNLSDLYISFEKCAKFENGNNKLVMVTPKLLLKKSS